MTRVVWFVGVGGAQLVGSPPSLARCSQTQTHTRSMALATARGGIRVWMLLAVVLVALVCFATAARKSRYERACVVGVGMH